MRIARSTWYHVSMLAKCPFCDEPEMVNITWNPEHLNEKQIPVKHPAVGEDHDWLLDKQSSKNLRKYVALGW
jgi:hypothetical protein